MWVSVADPDAAIAVTVRLYVPVGVPGGGSGVPLPPHEISAPVASIVTKSRTVTNSRRTGSRPLGRQRRAKVALASSTASASHPTGTLKGTIG